MSAAAIKSKIPQILVALIGVGGITALIVHFVGKRKKVNHVTDAIHQNATPAPDKGKLKGFLSKLGGGKLSNLFKHFGGGSGQAQNPQMAMEEANMASMASGGGPVFDTSGTGGGGNV